MNDADDRPLAVAQAEVGADAWVSAVRHQRTAAPDHSDFYALAGDMLATLYALDDLTRVLALQVARYGEGRPVYDDSRTVDPAARLAEAVTHLQPLPDHLARVTAQVNQFWSAIGHIGVEVDQ